MQLITSRSLLLRKGHLGDFPPPPSHELAHLRKGFLSLFSTPHPVVNSETPQTSKLTSRHKAAMASNGSGVPPPTNSDGTYTTHQGVKGKQVFDKFGRASVIKYFWDSKKEHCR